MEVQLYVCISCFVVLLVGQLKLESGELFLGVE